MGSPTEEQIKLVEKITEKLNIDFPICSQEFDNEVFNEFIKQHTLPVEHFAYRHCSERVAIFRSYI